MRRGSATPSAPHVANGHDRSIVATDSLAVDLAIVGAGLAGAAAAWAASRRGLSVALIERFTIGHPLGSSHGSARIFRRAYPDELYVRLTGEAAELWNDLEDDTSTTLLRVTGGLDHGAHRSVDVIAEYLATARIPHELCDPVEAQNRWPGMRFDSPVLFHPDAGVIDADGTISACVAAARRRGAVVLEGRAVESMIVEPDQVTLATGREIVFARRVIVAAGAWVQEVTRGLLAMPAVRVSQQQVFHFKRFDSSVDWPVFVHKDRLSTYGLPGGRDGGPCNAQKVAEHDGGATTTAETRDGIVDPEARTRLVDYVKQWLPGLDPDPINEATCLYTSTDDGDFVIDASGPLIVCSACSGHGAKFAPWLGTHLTRLALGEDQPLARFRLVRPPIGARS